jgi:hypothetical protein
MMEVAQKVAKVTGGMWAWLLAFVLLAVMVGESAQRLALMTYHKASPVIVDWQPRLVFVDGADVIVSGEMFKQYDCAYLPPPRAFDHAGRPFVVQATSTTPTLNFPTGSRPFGPWRIVGGAVSPKIDIMQEHDCGNDVVVFSTLGTLKRPYELPMKVSK